MAVLRLKPPQVDSKKSSIIRTRISSRPRVRSSGPILNRLTVVWVQTNGVNFNTTGFFARLSRGGRLVDTASFDRFGVVRFNVGTLTNVSYTLRVFSRNGILFRTRFIPAGVEIFAIIG